MLFQKFNFRKRVAALASTSTSHHWVRFISGISNSNFTLEYLINSCGLSPESALKASKRVKLKSPINPDSVLSLLKTHHIPQSHISKLITYLPRVLLANPHTTLQPKLQLLSNIGMSGSNLGTFLSNNNTFLTSSLQLQTMPSIHFFKNLVHTDTNVVKILRRLKRGIHDAECKMGPNIALLRHHGVSESNISKFLIASPQSLFLKPHQFNQVILDLKKMGLSHSDNMFFHCLRVRLGMNGPIWNAKLAVYKSFGWSEEEVLSIFKRQPFIMAISEKKMNLVINFFRNDLNWTLADLARCPTVLTYSLEKRVIPRNYVLRILLSKDLINKFNIVLVLKSTEDDFVKKFVTKYGHEVPNLWTLYQSKMSTQDDH